MWYLIKCRDPPDWTCVSRALLSFPLQKPTRHAWASPALSCCPMEYDSFFLYIPRHPRFFFVTAYQLLSAWCHPSSLPTALWNKAWSFITQNVHILLAVFSFSSCHSRVGTQCSTQTTSGICYWATPLPLKTTLKTTPLVFNSWNFVVVCWRSWADSTAVFHDSPATNHICMEHLL